MGLSIRNNFLFLSSQHMLGLQCSSEHTYSRHIVPWCSIGNTFLSLVMFNNLNFHFLQYFLLLSPSVITILKLSANKPNTWPTY